MRASHPIEFDDTCHREIEDSTLDVDLLPLQLLQDV